MLSLEIVELLRKFKIRGHINYSVINKTFLLKKKRMKNIYTRQILIKKQVVTAMLLLETKRSNKN